MKILFVCNSGINRSKKAAKIYSKIHTTDYLGIYNYFEDYGSFAMMKDEWTKYVRKKVSDSDVVFCMDVHQEEALRFWYGCWDKPIIVLNINDIYTYEDKNLVLVIKKKVDPILELIKYGI